MNKEIKIKHHLARLRFWVIIILGAMVLLYVPFMYLLAYQAESIKKGDFIPANSPLIMDNLAISAFNAKARFILKARSECEKENYDIRYALTLEDNSKMLLTGKALSCEENIIASLSGQGKMPTKSIIERIVFTSDIALHDYEIIWQNTSP